MSKLARFVPGSDNLLQPQNLLQQFPDEHKLIVEKGWVLGVWMHETQKLKEGMCGQYPKGFLERALALFPNAKDILHFPSGKLKNIPGTTVDLAKDKSRCPMIVASNGILPFSDNSLDLFLSAPPFHSGYAGDYKSTTFSITKMFKEAHRVLRPGGYVGILHTFIPQYKKTMFILVGTIGVVTGVEIPTRCFALFKSIKVNTS